MLIRSLFRRNKGLHKKATPDSSLRSSLGYWGSDNSKHFPSQTEYHTDGPRAQLLHDVMNQPYHKWMTLDQKDILMRTFKAIVRKQRDMQRLSVPQIPPSSMDGFVEDSLELMWQRAFSVLCKSKMHVELERLPDDPVLPGEATWINLDESTEHRLPKLWRMPGKKHLVLPVFTLDEYINHYWQRHECWESMWVPFPRNGASKDGFMGLARPVCGYGSFQNICRLATTAYGGRGRTFSLAINPCQPVTKFITFPEMVHISSKGPTRASLEKKDLPYSGFLTLVDTSQWTGEIVQDGGGKCEVLTPGEGKVPHIALLELHLLLLSLGSSQGNEVAVMSIQVCERAIAETLRVTALFGKFLGLDSGSGEKVVTIRVRCATRDQEEKVVPLLQQHWSFLAESNTKTEVVCATANAAAEDTKGTWWELYDSDLMTALRCSTRKAEKRPLRDIIDYDAPWE